MPTTAAAPTTAMAASRAPRSVTRRANWPAALGKAREDSSTRSTAPTRVLIAAHQDADSPQLVEAVARRANEGPCTFTLLVPAVAHGLHRVVDPEDHGHAEAEARLAVALPLLSDAAGEPIVGVVGSHEPFAAVQDALNLVGFDEVIISMRPSRMSRWLHLDLPRKIRALGIPVTDVTSAGRHMNDILPLRRIRELRESPHGCGPIDRDARAARRGSGDLDDPAGLVVGLATLDDDVVQGRQ